MPLRTEFLSSLRPSVRRRARRLNAKKSRAVAVSQNALVRAPVSRVGAVRPGVSNAYAKTGCAAWVERSLGTLQLQAGNEQLSAGTLQLQAAHEQRWLECCNSGLRTSNVWLERSTPKGSREQRFVWSVLRVRREQRLAATFQVRAAPVAPVCLNVAPWSPTRQGVDLDPAARRQLPGALPGCHTAPTPGLNPACGTVAVRG